ncbi:hypothetical protein BDF21DRAFT_431507 [Thamnidium elegans]|nr:hypothetical protein BDF21DRAFT_431507 [Thamnidium elegans]
MKKTSFWIQFICFLLILLSCLTIGFGSWLETNDLFYLSSPIISQRFSIFKIAMVADTKTLYLSIGLWRYCVSDTFNNINECSSIKMNFDIDAFTLMDSIIYTNLSRLPALTSVSYVRLIPLLISSFIGVVSACISLYLLPGNRKKSVQRKGLLWFASVLCLTSAGLVSATFGVTYYQYSRNIRNACYLVLSKHDINNTFICQSYTPSLEIILLGLAIGFFIISSIYCMFISSQNQLLADSCKTHNTNMSNFSFYVSEEDYHRPPVTSTIDIEEKQSADETVWNNKERLSLRPPPPFINNVKKVGCRSTTDAPLKVHHQVGCNNKPDSVTDINYVQPDTDIKFTSSSTEDVLLPPTLPFANNNRSSYNSRPLSHGSGNTFGAFSNGPSSPSADDASQASSSSYIDHQRSDSGTTYNPLYTTQGTQSNHTLGTFRHKPSSHAYLYYNSSFEDEDTRSFHNNSSENNTDTNNSSTVSNQSSIIPEQSSSNVLSKRIHDYLQQN